MMKRNETSEAEKEMLEKTRAEHELFMYRTLSGTAREIYASCKRICFYESLAEYFQYNEWINRDFIDASRGSREIINELWEIYLKYGYLRADTWEDIGNILKVYVEEHGRGREKPVQ